MKALFVLGIVFSCATARAAHVEWKAPLSDCLPADLVVSPEGHSFVACQKSFGTAAYLFSYGFTGSLNGTKVVEALDQGSLLPRDLLLHEGILYLALTRQATATTNSQLIALDPDTLRVLWEQNIPHFAGSSLVALPAGGIWWLGLDDARASDIQAFRYTRDGQLAAEFVYDSGIEDSLGFDRRSGAAGPDSSLYVGGFSQVLRVSSTGLLLWESPFATTAVISDAAGQLIATNLRAPEGNTAKFNADGRILWQIAQGGSALTEGPDHKIWIAGTSITDQASGWDLRLLQLNAGGQLLSRDSYDGKYQDRAVDVGTDAAGNGYVLASTYVKTGWFGTADRYLIMKYNPNGQRLWSQLYGIVGMPEALAVTADGDVYAVGSDGTILIKD